MEVAIIGAGRQGHRRAKAIKECGDSIALVVDTVPALLDEFSKAYKCETSTDWKKAMNDRRIDAIVICTPNDTHSVISIAALKAGKHVLCEKPLARNPEEAQKILDSMKKGGPVLKCGFNHRHHPAIGQAKQMVAEGKLGKLMFIRCRYGNTGRPDFNKDWRTNVSISGGGELMDQGLHAMDLFRWFGGEISEATGITGVLGWEISPAEDNAFALFRGKDGHICSLHTSWSEWRNIFSFEVFGTEGYVKIEGLGGSYGTETLITGRKDLSKPFSEDIKKFKDEDVSWVGEWREFASSIKEKRAPLGSAYDGWAAVKLAYAIYDSSKSGKTIKLDFKGA